MPNVKQIQNEYKLQPLSAYLGQPAPIPAPAVDWMTWKEGEDINEFSFQYQVVYMLPKDWFLISNWRGILALTRVF